MTVDKSAPEWVEQKERTSTFWLKLIRGIALKLPRNLVVLLLHPIVLFFLLISRKQTAASRHYLEQVLGRKPKLSEVYRHFLWFSTTILDRVYFLTGRVEAFEIENPNVDFWLDSLQKNPSQLQIGAHFGALDVMRAWSSDHYKVRVKVVLKVDQNQSLVQALNDLNPNMEETVIPNEGFSTIFKIHEALEEGHTVAMLQDRAVGNEATVLVDFFNDKMAMPISGFKLAKRFNIPIILFFGRFEGGAKYHIHTEHVAFEKGESVQEMAQYFADRLAEQCRISPYNWFNFYRYWEEPKRDGVDEKPNA